MKRLMLLVSLCGVFSTMTWPVCAVGLVPEQRVERARVVEAIPAGEVLVVLPEQLLNSLLEAMLSLPQPPTFPLARGGQEEPQKPACASQVALIRESLGTRTAVKFDKDRIAAPVAFRGAYDAPLAGCLKFEGWADTSFDLAFDSARQALTARLIVREVKLKNIPSLASGGVTTLVQDAIDKRVNPIEILRADQLSARLRVTPRHGLRLRAREVRHEVAAKELRLRIFYEIVRDE